MYKAKDQFFPPVVEGNIKVDGGALNLAVGQVAFVDISKSTNDGVKVLSDFSPIDPSAKLAIRMGEPNDNVSRSEDNKSISTIPFKLQDVVNIYVDAPDREGILVDDFVIGFNGEDGSEIVLDNGENEVIEVCLKGDLMGMIGLPDSKHVATINLTAPLDGVRATTATPAAGEWTMQEIIENAYTELKNYKLPGNIPITEYVDVMLVNSEFPATIPGTDTTFYSLTVADKGTESALGAVQAQYPNLDIKKTGYEIDQSTYTVISTSLPAPYQPSAKFALKGCDVCPAGYTELAQGFVYEVVIEDPTDATATVQALPGAEVGSAVLNDTVGDTNTYSVVTDDALTDAEIATFIGANPTASINLIAEDVADLCASPAPATVVWVEGETCKVDTESYTITLKDTECGESRLAELRAAYPELTITEGATSESDCQRVYTATGIPTNIVCEECGDIFRDLFVSEAPKMFGATSWVKAEKTYSGLAKMGIRVRGKRASIAGDEYLRDDMFFFDGSVEISLVGGYPTYTNESYLYGTNDRFTVKYFSRKADAQNLGGNLRKFEEEAQMHFRGRDRYVGNNYAKIATGQETRLEPLAQYIVYSITIAPHKYVSNFQQPQNGAFTYHFIVPMGKQEAFEGVVNKLASAAGLPQVQAVSK